MANPQLAAADALLIVDVQNDFCPGGALPSAGGDLVVPVLNRWIGAARAASCPVIASRDWHPLHHPSFAGEGGPWPRHCVQDTPGAGFRADLAVPLDAIVVTKGTRFDKDQNSAFDETGLAVLLAKLGIARVFVGGLALDVCVRATALDAIGAGLKVMLIVDGTRAVDEAAGAATLKELQAAGATLV
jgi:nicotinamidase/pyrazinamidase